MNYDTTSFARYLNCKSKRMHNKNKTRHQLLVKGLAWFCACQAGLNHVGQTDLVFSLTLRCSVIAKQIAKPRPRGIAGVFACQNTPIRSDKCVFSLKAYPVVNRRNNGTWQKCDVSRVRQLLYQLVRRVTSAACDSYGTITWPEIVSPAASCRCDFS